MTLFERDVLGNFLIVNPTASQIQLGSSCTSKRRSLNTSRIPNRLFRRNCGPCSTIPAITILTFWVTDSLRFFPTVVGAQDLLYHLTVSCQCFRIPDSSREPFCPKLCSSCQYHSAAECYSLSHFYHQRLPIFLLHIRKCDLYSKRCDLPELRDRFSYRCPGSYGPCTPSVGTRITFSAYADPVPNDYSTCQIEFV